MISIKLVKLSLWQWPKIANYMGQPNSKSKKQQHQQVKKKGTILPFVTLVSIFFLTWETWKIGCVELKILSMAFVVS